MISILSDIDEHIRTRNVTYFKLIFREIALEYLKKNNKEITVSYLKHNTNTPAPIEQRKFYSQ